jgi:3-methyladenine DNA glycosylase AlkC
MEPLRDMFSVDFYKHLAAAFKKAEPSFSGKSFVTEACSGLSGLSLNQRLRKTSLVLKEHLPPDFEKAVTIMKKVIPNTQPGYTNLIFPDYVGLYGHDHFEFSMKALKYFTCFGSSEFAIREFLNRDFKRTVKVMESWASDKNEHVRRLASEGSRPRLPWSFKLNKVISDPAVTLPVLESLKADNSLYVRKSVANHLNDISKDNPEFMLRTVGAWDHSDPRTAWIIRHASRTLIKKGHKSALSVFGLGKPPMVSIRNMKHVKKLRLGETFRFSFDLVSQKKSSQKLVVDYIIFYRKKNAALSSKVFKLKELELKAGDRATVSKDRLFKDFSTRKHFAGMHRLVLQVNGKALHSSEFELIL